MTTQAAQVTTTSSAATTAPGPDRHIRMASERLRTVIPFVAVQEYQAIFRHVYLEPHVDGGVLAVATDGFAAAMAYDPKGYAKAPTFIAGADLKALAKACRAKDAHQVDVYGDTCHVTSRYDGAHQKRVFDPATVDEIGVTLPRPKHWEILRLDPTPDAGRSYVDFRRVAPTEFPTTVTTTPDMTQSYPLPVSINLKILDRFYGVHPAARNSPKPIQIFPRAKGGLVAIMFADIDWFYAFAATMRGEAHAAPPSWVFATAPETEEVEPS